MATIVEQLKQASLSEEEKQQQVIDEIVNYFNEKLNAPEFEEDILKYCSSKDAIINRKEWMDTEFWGWSSGCSDTRFRTARITWENPENPQGYKSYYYKDVDLHKIQKQIGPKLLQMTVDKFKSLGFNVSVEDQESWLQYYHKRVTISW